MINYLKMVRNIVGPMVDAMPYPVFIVDENVSVVGLNRASQKMVGAAPEMVLRQPAGEVLHCLHSTETESGCGHAEYCKACIIRKSVAKAFKTQKVSRKKVRMEIISGDQVEEIFISVIASPFNYDGTSLVLLQIENMTEIMELRELVPICAGCHDIRVDDEYWQKIDSYLSKNFSLNFSHSLCPECLEKYYGEEDWFPEMKQKIGEKKILKRLAAARGKKTDRP
ncbi:MAG: PAS domain-containing protein [Desulfobacter sp.]|nr:MAG: PAS domain-containing protein [Desulfobacter sp.]